MQLDHLVLDLLPALREHALLFVNPGQQPVGAVRVLLQLLRGAPGRFFLALAFHNRVLIGEDHPVAG